MWWLLKIVAIVILVVLLVVVATSNSQPVDVKILGWQFQQIPLYLVMLGSALFGLLAGLVIVGVREVQWRVQNARQGREQAGMRRELQELRKAPLRGLDEPDERSQSAPDRML